MKFIQVTRTGQYTDLAICGLSLGRILLWTVLVAVLHRLLSVGLLWLGWFVAGAGFAPGHPNSRFHLPVVWTFQAILDFPILVLHHIGLIRAHFVLGSGFLEPFGSGLQLIWSLLLGLIVAILITWRTTSHDSHART